MRKRIISKLDIKDHNLVKGIQLEGLRVLGNPNDFAKEPLVSLLALCNIQVICKFIKFRPT